MASAGDRRGTMLSQQGSAGTPSAGSGVTDISQVLRDLQSLPTAFQANSEVTVEKDYNQYVRTDSFREAEDVLKDTGRVVLCGPTGCGKTTAAYALCRMCRLEGYAVYVLERLEQWKSRVGERGRSVVVLDGTFGKVRVDGQQYACWERIVDTLLQALKDGSCRLIISVYPHVLRELQQLESNNPDSPFLGVRYFVDMADNHPSQVKRKMLNFHFNKLKAKLDPRDVLYPDPERQAQAVEDVMSNDVSGPVFPWCCAQMTHHWRSTQGSTAIFSMPAEAYADLLKKMVVDQTHGAVFAAVFCLTMQGRSQFLRCESEEIARRLKELGFGDIPPVTLARYEDVLQGSVLSQAGFSSRIYYDAAVLVVARFLGLDMLFRLCDARFLVKNVQATVMKNSGLRGVVRDVRVTVGSASHDFQDQRHHEQVFQGLLQRICDDLVDGKLQHMSQHPCLQHEDFLSELLICCCAKRGRLQNLLNAVDSVHQLPLLYWSVFHPTDVLTHWCLAQQQNVPELPAWMLVAFFLFDNLTGSSKGQLLPSLLSGLTAKHFHHPARVMDLPLLGTEDRLTADVQKRMEAITGASPRYLAHVADAALPIPPEVVRVELRDNSLQLEVGDSSHWYLLYRLLTDTHRAHTDQQGLTLLDLAVSTGQSAAMALALKAGALITQTDRQGLTVYQRAHRIRALAAKNRTEDYIDGVFDRLHEMDMVEVQLLLLQEVSVDDKDRNGGTCLHVACCDGRGDIADLLIELGADVNVRTLYADFDDEDLFMEPGLTPLHSALRGGLVVTAQLLLERGAEVRACTEAGSTALHYACVCDSHSASVDLTCLLLRAWSDVNVKDEDCRTPLIYAAEHGHADTVDLLLQHGADLTVQDKRVRTPLLVAAANGHLETVQLLLERGAQTGVRDGDRNTLLHVAAKEGHGDIVGVLLKRGADVNVQNNEGDTPLLLAVMGDNGCIHWTSQCQRGLRLSEGRRYTALLLLQHGAQVNVQNTRGETALQWAARYGGSDTVAALIRRGASIDVPDKQGVTPLRWAVRQGHSDTARLLLTTESDADVVNAQNGSGSTHLNEACMQGHIDIVRLLTDGGARVNVQDRYGRTPLYVAAMMGHTDIVVLLLTELGADIRVKDERGSTPIHLAATRGHLDIVRLLAERGADVNVQTDEGNTPLLLAVSQGDTGPLNRILTRSGLSKSHSDTALLLLQHGARVNVRNAKGETALHWAVFCGDSDIVVSLIQRGADVNAQDGDDGNRPIHVAAIRGHVADVLLKHGADVNARNNEGDTPLLLASGGGDTRLLHWLLQRSCSPYLSEGHIDTSLLLLQHGAQVNVHNAKGETALHRAAYCGHSDIVVAALLQRGANVNVRDNQQITPLQCAIRAEHRDIADLLRQHGAQH